MTGPGFRVDPGGLASSGAGLESVAAEFMTAVTAFQAQLEGFGRPWGNDDIGSLIGVAHDEVSAFAFECFSTAMEEIGAAGLDLSGMAEQYREIEERIRGVFDSFAPGAGG